MRTQHADKRRQLLFALLHQFPSTFFLFGQPFYTTAHLGWGLRENLLVQGLIGLCIALGSYIGGQVAHRARPRVSIAIGLSGGLVAALAGLGTASFPVGSALLAIVALFSFSQAMVWPGIEAALMEDESPARVQDLVGYFNLTWSFGTATALLVATALLHYLGLNAFFTLPAALFAANLLFLPYFHPGRKGLQVFRSSGVQEGAPASEPECLIADHGPQTADYRPIQGQSPHSQPNTEHRTPNTAAAGGPPPPQTPNPLYAAYRWLAWTANPFVYVAINVVVTYNPTTQARLGLGVAASAWLSLWLYARMATFELARRWSWWHYRWRFLCLCFGAMMGSFLGMVLAPSLPALLLAQIAFGLSSGLIYQSSLYYAMAGSEAQGAHGGAHETLIGLGQMVGPLIAYLGAKGAGGSTALPAALVLLLMTGGLIALAVAGLRIGRLEKSLRAPGFNERPMTDDG